MLCKKGTKTQEPSALIKPITVKLTSMMTSSLINWTLKTIKPQVNAFTSPFDLLDSIGQLQALPVLPGIVLRVMQLATDSTANAEKLASIIELDPFLTTQIIGWASSSLYAYPGKIISVQEAISRVLGYDFAFNLVLGLSAIAPLKTCKDGPVGIRAFWINAMASSRLMPLLNSHLPLENRFKGPELFLTGFLHNIGHPLLGNYFPREHSYLNKLIIANPNLSTVDLERFALGIDHNALGAWLMSTWAMPKEIVDVTYHHHNPNYRGDNYQLNLLTYLNDCLLGELGLGDAQIQGYSTELLSALNLPAEAINESLDKLNDMLVDIVVMANSIIG